MSVATSTAIAIGLGAAGAASSVYGANKAAGAAKTAAGLQEQSVNRAQDFQQQAWQQQQQALAPYRQMGINALNALQARQYGPGGTQGQNAGAIGLQNAPGWQGGGFSLASLQPGGGGMPGGMVGQRPFNQQPTMAPPMPPQGQPQMQQPQGGGALGNMMQGVMGMAPQAAQMAQQGGGAMVSVQDDSGEVRQVPQAQAQMLAQRGFRVVG